MPGPFDAFQDAGLARSIVQEIHRVQPGAAVKLMHVCGTHENAIALHGLRGLLPDWLKVIAGPGCPVCVCPASDIQMAVDLALTRSVVVATFGDMFRVPARMSLSEAKAQGGDIRVVFSVMDAVDLARREPDREVVFFAVGFETTAVTTAAAATGDVPANFSLLVSHRTIPTALSALLATPDIGVAGFLLPGHVITVMGTADYEELASRDRVPVAVGGFEPVDVLLGILELARMVAAGKPALVNCYRRAVRPEGNRKALAALAHAFEACDAHWRAIGSIPGSGLALRPELSRLDAQKRFGLVPDLALEEVRPGCSCGAVMLGKVEPSECPLFAKGCTPVRPYGPCMVSMEGTCRNAYKYRSV